MDIKNELSKTQTVLMIMESSEYNKEIVNIMMQLSGKSVFYVTLNKTYSSLKELFEKNNINTDNVVFIDSISKTIMSAPDQKKDCYFCSSPGALTEISLTIAKMMDRNFEYIIFDSLTNLLIYKGKAPVAKFVSSLINKIKAGNTKALFYVLSVKEQDELIKETEMFVDGVINLEKADEKRGE